MRFICSLLFCVFFSLVPLHADLILSNESPRWGEAVQVHATLNFSKDTLYPGDQVFLVIDSRYQGQFKIEYANMSWNGEGFTAEVVIPSGCETVILRVLTPEKQIRYYQRIYPMDTDGNPPPGSIILSANSKTEDEWLATAVMELEKYPEIWWAYHEIWRSRIFGWRNLTTEELLQQVKSLEKHEKTAELLRTLAMGYWYSARFKTAYARLEEICQKFPDSPYALHAINDAQSQAFTNDLTDTRSLINQLTVDIIEQAPENPILRYHHNATAWLCLPGHSIETLERVCNPWIIGEPDNPKPHYYLGQGYLRTGQLEEADTELTQALLLAFNPRPWELFIRSGKGYMYRLRSEVRVKQGRLAEALADCKLAQEHTYTNIIKDLETEASLWIKLGFPEKAEETAIAAYRQGSQEIESFLEELYAYRSKNDDGFKDWLSAKLEGKSEIIASDRAFTPSPGFKGTTMQGESIDSNLFKDDLVILNFWFTACGPCIREIPELNKLVEKYQANIHFLAFSADTKERIQTFLKKHPFKFKIIPNARDVEQAFDISSHPTHVVIKNGRILWKGYSGSSESIERLEGLIKRNLNGLLR
jgi:tetratricopeptide (TPR) repeat protein